jgi:GntR family transcriptional regulator / MocR family aminotransferase
MSSQGRAGAVILALSVDRRAAVPLYVQLYDQLRAMVLDGRIGSGGTLPSTRALARELGISRTTVIQAFDQLRAEGYIEGAKGSGTYAARVPPDALAGLRQPPASRVEGPPPVRFPARRARAVDGTGWRMPTGSRAFVPGLPDTDHFPFEQWSRLSARFWRAPPRELLSHGEPAGFAPLRRAIAEHLRLSRGLACDPDQIVVTHGTREAVELIVRTLIDPGDTVWVEEPGYAPIRHALTLAGARLAAVTVGPEGMSTADALATAPDARMAVVTPSRQFPLGVPLSLANRLTLLEWAQGTDSWIVEDDYDSEYRYSGLPIPPLQTLDGSGRVIYLGSFSKVLFPTLRIGYIVAPPSLVATLLDVRAAFGDAPSMAAQPMLAEFMDSGLFAQHIRRMRRLYAERQKFIVELVRRDLSGWLEMDPDAGGMHLVARLGQRLPRDADDRRIAKEAADRELTVPPLSAYYTGTVRRKGLLIGYAGVPEDETREGLRRLGDVLAAADRA